MEELQIFMDDFSESLPTADFDLESSENEDNTDSEHVTIFCCSEHLKPPLLTESSESLDPCDSIADSPLHQAKLASSHTHLQGEGEVGYSSERELEDELESLGMRAKRNLHESDSHGAVLPVKSTNEDDILGDSDSKWNQFKKEFDSQFDSSEAEMHQLEFHKLREELLIAALDTVGQDRQNQQADVTEEESTSRGKYSLLANSELLDFTADLDLASAVPYPPQQTTPSSPRANSAQRHGILHSNRFERINEAELESMLEAIEEESEHSREGSRSPATMATTNESNHFLWQPPEQSSQQLLYQLEQMCLKDDNGFPGRKESTGKSEAVSEPKNNKVTGTSDRENKEKATVFMDLRPYTDEVAESKVSTSVQRLMKMRRPVNRSSSDDSEDSGDPYSWQIQREHFKRSLAMTPLAKPTSEQISTVPRSMVDMTFDDAQFAAESPSGQNISVLIPTVSSDQEISPKSPLQDSGSSTATSVVTPAAAPSKHLRRRKFQTKMGLCTETQKSKASVLQSNRERKPSSSSLSEDDVFLPSYQDSLGERRSSGERVASSTSVLRPSDIHPPDKHKKSRRKKKGKKSYDTDSAIEGERGSCKSESSRKKTGSQRSARIRSSSLTQSSDDDLHEGVAKIQHSSEHSSPNLDTSETGVCVERVKLYLQHMIHARKPPGLLNIPSTPPLFHMDVSFGPVLTTTNPFMSSDVILLLPLADSKGPQNLLLSADCNSQHVLFTLLVTWLVSLATDIPSTEQQIFAPFHVTGLLQSVFEGQTCLIVTVSVPDTGRDKTSAVLEILELSLLSQVLATLLCHQEIASAIPDTAYEMIQSLSEVHLSDLFTIEQDITQISVPLSFYWLSQYSASNLPTEHALLSSISPETTSCTISLAKPELSLVPILFTVLSQSLARGLDLTGLRLLYPSPSVCQEQPTRSVEEAVFDEPLLALAFRGPNANSVLGDISGPADVLLAKITDPCSINALYGSSSSPLPLSGAHGHFRTEREIAKWFGGRACLKTGTVLGVSDPTTKSQRRKRQRVRFSESESEDNLPLSADMTFPPLVSNRPALIIPPYGRIIFVLSPHIHPALYGTVVRTVGECGFDLLGMKRLRLNFRRSLALGIPSLHIVNFAPASTPPCPPLGSMQAPFSLESCMPGSSTPPLPSLLLVLGRENALSHCHFLKVSLFHCIKTSSSSHMVMPGLVESGPHRNVLNTLFHGVEYSEECVKSLGSFVFTPSTSNGGKLSDLLLSEKYKEELAFVAVPNSCSSDRVADILDVLAGLSCTQTSADEEEPCPPVLGLMELIGLKLVPELSRFQAKQLCLVSNNNTLYRELVDHLTGNVTVLMVVRGLNCCQKVRQLLFGGDPETEMNPRVSLNKLEPICSTNLDQAFHLTSLFFIDKELYSNAKQWALGPYLPPACLHDCAMLSGLQQDPEPLLSVFCVSITRIRLLVKILEKLTIARFEVIAMTTHWQQDLPSIAVCVQRYNAVWYLKYLLEPFTLSSSCSSDALSYCSTFVDSVKETQRLFTDGVHSPHPAVLKHYQVSQASGDCFVFHDTPSSPVPHFVPQSAVPALLEWTVLIVPPALLEAPSSCPPFINILHYLSQTGFSLSELQMVQFAPNTAQLICDSVGPCSLEPLELSCGPCLLMGIWRDNAVSCFHSIIQSSFQWMGMQVVNAAAISELFCKVIVPSTKTELLALNKVISKVQRESLF